MFDSNHFYSPCVWTGSIVAKVIIMNNVNSLHWVTCRSENKLRINGHKDVVAATI